MGCPQQTPYATFDHPILKLSGINAVVDAWRQREPKVPGPEYIFLDEAQFIRDWGVWVKHQVDFVKSRRIVFTGSAMLLLTSEQESGVGRWHVIRLATLSFYEYLQIKKLELPTLPKVNVLQTLLDAKPSQLLKISEQAAPCTGHFHEYLMRGGLIYLADAAISPAVMLKGKGMLDDPAALGVATETAVFKHLFARYYSQQVRFTYWRGKQDHDVNLVAEMGGN